MKNSAYPLFKPFPTFFLAIMLGLMPVSAWTQAVDTCTCEKFIWKVKVKLKDAAAPFALIDYKTFNGKLVLTDQTEDEGEYPARAKLRQYSFGEQSLVIHLDPAEIQRASYGGGQHRVSETGMGIFIEVSLAENQIWYQPEDKCILNLARVGVEDPDTDFKLQNLKRVHDEKTAGYEGRGGYSSRFHSSSKYWCFDFYEIVHQDLGRASWNLKPLILIAGKDSDCISARCYMPLRVTFLWGEPEEDRTEEVGTVIRPQEDLAIKVYSTGRTTGHVIDIWATNSTADPINYAFGPAVVPATGKYQGYTILEEYTGTVPPGEQVTVPIAGYCYDVHTEPVPAGYEMEPLSEWISSTEAGPVPTPGFVPNEDSAFEPFDVSTISADSQALGFTYPGTDTLFPYTIDIRKHPDEAAALLLESMRLLDVVYDSLQSAGLVTTPFSYDPAKERESVLQQSYWVVTSRLDGDPYTSEQLAERLIAQFEELTQTDYEDAPPVVKDQLEAGTNAFWSSFELVGEEAKVLHRYAEAHPGMEHHSTPRGK